MRHSSALTIFAPLALCLVACAGEGGSDSGHPDTDTDSDTDTDADADSDTDSDADTDSDTDTDADADSDSDTDADADTCNGTPCGGDPAGDWTIVETCVGSDHLTAMSSCPASYLVYTDFNLVGGFTVGADSTYELYATGGDASYDMYLPRDCFGGEDCATLEGSLSGMTCVDDGADACLCSGTSAINADSDTGTCSVDGTNLDLSSDDGSHLEYPFCVDGNSLWVSVPAAGGAPGFELALTK